MIKAKIIFDDGYTKDLVLPCSIKGLKRNNQRPTKCVVYQEDGDDYTAIDIKHIKDYIYKSLGKLLHPRKREFVMDQAVLDRLDIEEKV